MNRWEKGMLAKSLAGHDKNKVYVIAELDETYVYLVDGETRTFEKMKKKKRIHVQLIRRKYNITKADNASIRYALKEYEMRGMGMKEEI